jgi:predicted nucleotide-binding protein
MPATAEWEIRDGDQIFMRRLRKVWAPLPSLGDNVLYHMFGLPFMARRPTQSPPPPRVLTTNQIRRRIEGLQRCIAELQAFDPQRVQKRYNIPEVIALEASIKDALGAAFGHGTPRFDLYRDAADLDKGPHVMRSDPMFGGMSDQQYDAQDASEARQYLAEGKERSVQLLQGAIRSLEDEVADQEPKKWARGETQNLLSRKIFIVHGHAGEPREAVARFLAQLDFEPIILHEQANQGRTIIEKFEDHAEVGFAIILLTPDDVGSVSHGDAHPRARQNVILELGYFIGRLGRSRVCALKVGELELPSDILGIVWTPFDAGGAWKLALGRELQAAGFDIDWNKFMRS